MDKKAQEQFCMLQIQFCAEQQIYIKYLSNKVSVQIQFCAEQQIYIKYLSNKVGVCSISNRTSQPL